VLAPDLVINAASGPATAKLATFVTFSVTTFNQGGGAAYGFVYTGIYLSTDPVITTADRYLGSVYQYNLAGGAGATQGLGMTLPALAPGTYYVGAIADYNARNAESNEANNSFTGNLIILTP
jgi:subtilase family serine protease